VEDTKSNVAQIEGLVQKALHRAAGKLKGSSKNTRAFPVSTVTKLNCSERNDPCIVCYHTTVSETVQSSKLGVSAQQPDIEKPLCSAVDDTDN
jgi:hypothetical protein